MNNMKYELHNAHPIKTQRIFLWDYYLCLVALNLLSLVVLSSSLAGVGGSYKASPKQHCLNSDKKT